MIESDAEPRHAGRLGAGLADLTSAVRELAGRTRAERRLEHLALHDSLTGLPNRALLADRLEHALERSRRLGTRLAVYFCDLDDFKRINDSLGHDAGDELLAALPPRLRDALRPADTVARFGGDELVILCEDVGPGAEAVRLVERISAAFRRPFRIEGSEHHLSASIGVVAVERGEAAASELIRDAEIAMYRAKAAGGGGFELFDARMRAAAIERLRIEEDLRRALEREELELFYQPLLSLERDEFVGAEALLRWRHPDLGLLEPAEFIDVAEESGLIIPIGAWVAAEACREAASWPERDGRAPEISINLSPRQVTDPQLVDAVAAALGDSGIDPGRVGLEITETALLEGADVAGANLQRLKSLGVRLALDDFGTGYSSLGRLKRFPIDVIKVDREFVDGLAIEAEDTAIVTAVLSMARALDVEVVAEGVEAPEQLAWLAEHGCRLAQGFLLHPPLPPRRLELVAPWRPANGHRGDVPAGTVGAAASATG